MNKEIFDKLPTNKQLELIKWTCEAETINSVNKDTLRAMVQFMWIWFQEIDLEKSDGYAMTKKYLKLCKYAGWNGKNFICGAQLHGGKCNFTVPHGEICGLVEKKGTAKHD